MAIDKGKEVVPLLEKGKEVVTPLEKGKGVAVPVREHRSAKLRNYRHYHEESRPGHFCKIILGPKLKSLPMPLEFPKHFLAVPTEFKLKTNTRCAWRVTVRVADGRVTLDQGSAKFVAVHQILIGYMVMIKFLTPNTMKMIVFNDDIMKVVTKCKKHDDVFVVTA